MTGELIDRVRLRLADQGSRTDAMAVAEAMRAETQGLTDHAEVPGTLRLLRNEFIGAGPLEPLLAKPDTTDVMVSGCGQVWVEGSKGLEKADIYFPDEESVRRLAQRLAMLAGRRLDDAQPYVDGWLPETGSARRVRLHAVIPPITPDGTCISLRVLRPAVQGLSALRELGTFPGDSAELIKTVISTKLAFLITGSTGSGKSTLLAAMLGEVPANQRIVCVDDAGELQPNHPQFVRLTARGANVEGAGEVALCDLVRQALRMRPDRLVVGEIRGREVCELLTALNTGHEGGGCTLHANSIDEAPARLEALACLGGFSSAMLHSQLGAAIHVVLHMNRGEDGQRQLTEVGVLRRGTPEVDLRAVWRDGCWTEYRSDFADLVERKKSRVR
jgi:pilus assembly protein CpaF